MVHHNHYRHKLKKQKNQIFSFSMRIQNLPGTAKAELAKTSKQRQEI